MSALCVELKAILCEIGLSKLAHRLHTASGSNPSDLQGCVFSWSVLGVSYHCHLFSSFRLMAPCLCLTTWGHRCPFLLETTSPR